MDDTSMWLQDSVHMPDAFEEELRLMRREPAVAPQPSTTLSQHALRPNSSAVLSQPSSRQPAVPAPFSSSQRFGATSMAAPAPLTTPRGTPVTTPTSSQPQVASSRVPRPSMAAADFLVQQQFQQATEALQHANRELADARDEIALLTKTTNAEKETATMWRNRYQHEVAKADDALAQSQIRMRAAVAERDEATAAARRVEADFAAARAEWQRTADDRADLRRQLGEVLSAKDTMEREVRALERRVQELQDVNTANSRVREQLATLESEFRAVRDESEEVQRQLESSRVEFEIRLQAALDGQRQDYASELRALEEDYAVKINMMQQQHAEQLSQARQRLSQNEQARDEARRALEQLAEERDRVASTEADLQRAKEHHDRFKQRTEQAHASELQLVKQEHEESVRRLIDEHNEERAELRRRLSNGEAAASRLLRLEADLTAERERADELQLQLDSTRREADEVRRTSTRRDELAEQANRRAFEAETRLAEVEATMSETIARERQQLHDRIEGLLAQIEMANRDHAVEADEFAEQLQEARQRQSTAESMLAEQRSQFSKERLLLMKNESSARSELNQVMEERDDALRSRRQAEGRAADAEAHAQALERRVASLETALDELRELANLEQRQVHNKSLELQHARAHIDELQARLSYQENEGRRAIGGSMLQRHDRSAPQSNAPSPSPAPVNPMLTATNENVFHASTTAPQPREPERRIGQRHPLSSAQNFTPAASVPLTVVEGGGLTPRMPFGTESLNTQHTISAKRHRSEEPQNQHVKIFAVTGFDQRQLGDQIAKLPNAEMAQVTPNSAIPSTVTHLLTTGQLTVKLLTALVKGCWVLPEAYLDASLQAGAWQPEERYGFRHKRPVVQGRVFAFTDAFRGTRHFSTAMLVAKEGGADVRAQASLDEACEIPQCTVLCTPQEHRDVRSAYPALHLMTWDTLVKMIYPPNAMPSITPAAA